MLAYFPLEHLWLLSRVLPARAFDRAFAPALRGTPPDAPARREWGNRSPPPIHPSVLISSFYKKFILQEAFLNPSMQQLTS
jgi:hypothetical protein